MRSRIGVIGAGGVVTNLHLPVLLSMERVRVAWICDIDLPAASRVASAFGVSRAIGSLDAATDVDAVLIATPVGARLDLVRTSARRGWNALCEKPFARNVSEHLTMIDLARAAGTRLVVGLVRRAYASTLLATDLVRSGMLGEVVHAASADGGRVHVTGRSSGWYQGNAAAAGGGVLVETGPHVIDQMLTVLRATDARATRAALRYVDGMDIDAAVDLDIGVGDRIAAGRVHVSRSRDLYNGVVVRGGRGEMRVGVLPHEPVTFIDGERRTVEIAPTAGPLDILSAFRAQWTAFLFPSAEEDLERDTGLAVTSLIEQAYTLGASS